MSARFILSTVGIGLFLNQRNCQNGDFGSTV